MASPATRRWYRPVRDRRCGAARRCRRRTGRLEHLGPRTCRRRRWRRSGAGPHVPVARPIFPARSSPLTAGTCSSSKGEHGGSKFVQSPTHRRVPGAFCCPSPLQDPVGSRGGVQSSQPAFRPCRSVTYESTTGTRPALLPSAPASKHSSNVAVPYASGTTQINS